MNIMAQPLTVVKQWKVKGGFSEFSAVKIRGDPEFNTAFWHFK